ncbi:hypothetical protein Hanom_Chr16g01476241 [Helianthus anomalus]
MAKVDYSTAGSPLILPRYAETRPPPARRHDSGIIGKTSPPVQVKPAPPIFALHLDATENNEESGNRTWITIPNHSTTTSLAMRIGLGFSKSVKGKVVGDDYVNDNGGVCA